MSIFSTAECRLRSITGCILYCFICTILDVWPSLDSKIWRPGGPLKINPPLTFSSNSSPLLLPLPLTSPFHFLILHFHSYSHLLPIFLPFIPSSSTLLLYHPPMHSPRHFTSSYQSTLLLPHFHSPSHIAYPFF